MKSPKSFGRLKKPRLYVRRVVGSSMEPTLLGGQLVLFVSRRPQVGDIVMVQHDGKEKIKRLTQIGTGRVYLLGDNLLTSTDSRVFGWLPSDTVRGKLIWPRNRKIDEQL